VIVTSSITNEAVDELALRVGDDAFAVIEVDPDHETAGAGY
jgi:molybdopterin-binding protein